MILVMELLSDLIPGSGASIAGIIDNDVSHDEFGLPYFPAKRLRGILRETASELEFLGLLEQPDIEELFGVAGETSSSTLHIDNGLIDSSNEMVRFLEMVQHGEAYKKYRDLFSPQRVLDYFSYTRAQTAVEGGTAKKRSLRLNRVLRKGLKFSFQVDCSEEHRGKLDLICKGVHSAGLSRNRGLGEIALSLKNDTSSGMGKTLNIDKTGFRGCSGNDLFEIVLNVRNLSELLVSDTPGNGDVSNSYIPGTFVLGAFASKYLHGKSRSSSDRDFQEIFLSGNVVFSNLYPGPDVEKSSMPVPFSLRQVENTDYYLDETYCEDDTAEESLKKNAHGYVSYYSGNILDSYEPRMDIEFHHRRPADKALGRPVKPGSDVDSPGTFFQYQILKKGQYFRGSIVGSRDDIDKICGLIPSDGILRLGKSKAGQYGKCKIETAEIEPFKPRNELPAWPAGADMIFTLTSDAILFNSNGFPDPSPEALVDEIALRLSVEPALLESRNLFVHRRDVGGYLGVWNLPRIQYPALSAGSILVLRNSSGRELDMKGLAYKGIGLRTEDGFGRLYWKLSDSNCSRYITLKSLSFQENDVNPMRKFSDKTTKLVQWLRRNKIKQDIKYRATKKVKNYDLEGKKVNNIPESFVEHMLEIINNSSRIEDFIETIKQFEDKPAGSNLRRMSELLLVEIKNGNDNLAIKTRDFNERIVKQSDGYDIKALRILGCEKLFPYDKEEMFSFYKIYAASILTSLKLRNRNNRNKSDLPEGGAR